MPNGRRRNTVLILAATYPAPSTTASSASKCVSRLRPLSTSDSRSFTIGTLEDPPSSSTPASSSAVTSFRSMISSRGATARDTTPADSAARSNSSLVTSARKSTPGSRSSMLKLISVFADSTCLTFCACFRSLATARVLSHTSPPLPVSASNLATSTSISTASSASPPALCVTHATSFTSNWLTLFPLSSSYELNSTSAASALLAPRS